MGDYLIVRASIGSTMFRTLAQRLVWRSFRGPIPEGTLIKHVNGIKTDNRIDNLESVGIHNKYSTALYNKQALARFLSKTKPSEAGCLVWCGATANGYGKLTFNGKVHSAHRLALTILRGLSIPDDKLVLHSCDNPSCVNPDHLSIGTQSDNMKDASRKGRIRGFGNWAGENNPKAKLRIEQSREVARRFTAGETSKALAREFGVSTVRVTQLARSFAHRTDVDI